MSFSFSSKLFLRILLATALFIPAANGQIVVDSLDDPGLPADGLTTLREAIDQANLTGSVTITFDVSLSGGTIQPLSQLPTITGGGITIDGDLDDDNVPDIEIDGTLAGNSSGIRVESANNRICGLVVNRFTFRGIHISGVGANGNVVTSCYLGTDATGKGILGNRREGIFLGAASNNMVGPNNVSSGNDLPGIVISGGTANHIFGNFVGTDPAGSTDLGNSSVGVWIRGGATTATVENNVISGNASDGLVIDGGANHIVRNNFVGTDASGSLAIPNNVGIWIRSSATNSTVGPGNVVSGNLNNGVIISGEATGNSIFGNRIGTNASGTTAIPNVGTGVAIGSNSNSNIVGPGNVISGNQNQGLTIDSASFNVVKGNKIGTDVFGVATVANGSTGVWIGDSLQIGSSDNLIGGVTLGDRNIISGNSREGVSILNANSNTVAGNFVGTDVTGSTALANAGSGITIRGESSLNTIGPGNVVSGNDSEGIVLTSGAHDNIVIANKAGTDITGTFGIRNYWSGILLQDGSHHNTIGGQGGDGNLSSGNRATGIVIRGAGTDFNIVVGNKCGTDLTGTTSIPSGGSDVGSDGISIYSGASNNIIGPGNMFAFNSDRGVYIGGSTTMANIITENSIWANGGPNLSLQDGANNGIAAPLITFVSTFQIAGLANVPNGSIIEIFHNPANAAQAFLGSTLVQDLGFTFVGTIPSGGNITATVTDLSGNTSEFGGLLPCFSLPPISFDIALQTVPAEGIGPAYTFRMGKFEVTSEQYAVFLNDAEFDADGGLPTARSSNMVFDPDGTVRIPNGATMFQPKGADVDSRILYVGALPVGSRYAVACGFEDHPVVEVSWLGAVKFCNWLTIEKGLGETQRCYTEGANIADWHPVTIAKAAWISRNLNDAERQDLVDNFRGYRLPMDNLGVRWTFLSFQENPFNEWYKAAAYDPAAPDTIRGPIAEKTSPDHWLYGFGRDTISGADANYLDSGDPFVAMGTTPVGFFDGTLYNPGGGGPVGNGNEFQTNDTNNPYALYDLSGNVKEWGQDLSGGPDLRSVRGGGFNLQAEVLTSIKRFFHSPDSTDANTGFRVVQSIRPGDLDMDGDVDPSDFLTFAICFNEALNPPRPGCASEFADMDEDGDVDVFDFLTFSGCFNGALTPPGCP